MTPADPVVLRVVDRGEAGWRDVYVVVAGVQVLSGTVSVGNLSLVLLAVPGACVRCEKEVTG